MGEGGSCKFLTAVSPDSRELERSLQGHPEARVGTPTKQARWSR
jgi:hypothetical protein